MDETSFESEKTNQLSWFPNLKSSKEKSGELAILVPQISTLRDVKKFLKLGKVILRPRAQFECKHALNNSFAFGPNGAKEEKARERQRDEDHET